MSAWSAPSQARRPVIAWAGATARRQRACGRKEWFLAGAVRTLKLRLKAGGKFRLREKMRCVCVCACVRMFAVTVRGHVTVFICPTRLFSFSPLTHLSGDWSQWKKKRVQLTGCLQTLCDENGTHRGWTSPCCQETLKGAEACAPLKNHLIRCTRHHMRPAHINFTAAATDELNAEHHKRLADVHAAAAACAVARRCCLCCRPPLLLALSPAGAACAVARGCCCRCPQWVQHQ